MADPHLTKERRLTRAAYRKLKSNRVFYYYCDIALLIGVWSHHFPDRLENIRKGWREEGEKNRGEDGRN